MCHPCIDISAFPQILKGRGLSFTVCHQVQQKVQCQDIVGLYQTRIQSLLDNVAEWLPVESCNAVNIEISNGFTPTMQVSLRPYVPFSQDALTHVLFRGTEAGMITPKAESTAFSLENGTLTPEKIDAYCDSLAFDLALNEGRKATDRNRLASHILIFATTQCAGLQEVPSIEGVCNWIVCHLALNDSSGAQLKLTRHVDRLSTACATVLGHAGCIFQVPLDDSERCFRDRHVSAGYPWMLVWKDTTPAACQPTTRQGFRNPYG